MVLAILSRPMRRRRLGFDIWDGKIRYPAVAGDPGLAYMAAAISGIEGVVDAVHVGSGIGAPRVP